MPIETGKGSHRNIPALTPRKEWTGDRCFPGYRVKDEFRFRETADNGSVDITKASGQGSIVVKGKGTLEGKFTGPFIEFGIISSRYPECP